MTVAGKPMQYKLQIFCDFDGTITTCDTIDALLSELADPQWEEIEAEWVRGEISSRECMERQVALIRGGWNRVKAFLDTMTISPGVQEFVNWCHLNSIPFMVVSDGLDRVIEYLLAKHEIKADKVYANHLVESAGGDFSMQASARPRLLNCGSGVCKCQILGSQAYQLIRVVIGDGRSDFCWSKEADLVFAKSKLIEFCSANNIAFNPFEDFGDINAALEVLNSGNYEKLRFNKEIPGLPLSLPSVSTPYASP